MTDLKGRVAIVTGANTGIGRVTALELARRGAEVVLACRSPEKTHPVLAEIRAATSNDAVELLELDLGDFDSVRGAARRFVDSGRPLHLLVNNAGLAGHRGLSQSGFEIAFGVNHLGHFLFTDLLLDRLKASAPARIVNVSSIAHFKATEIDWVAAREPTKTVTGLLEYQRSKLANVLFTKELARRLGDSGVTTYALHPGVVASDVWRRVPRPFRWLMKWRMISNEEGAETTLHCATSPALDGRTGGYYDGCKEKPASALACDETLAKELWERSAAWVA